MLTNQPRMALLFIMACSLTGCENMGPMMTGVLQGAVQAQALKYEAKNPQNQTLPKQVNSNTTVYSVPTQNGY